MPATILCLFAEKGGVGRTTLTINLGAVFAEQGHRVLLVDTDSQASLSQFFLGSAQVDRLHKSETVAALFDDGMDPDPESLIKKTSVKGIDVLPASDYLKEHNHANPEQSGDDQIALSDCLSELRNHYDYILLDTPPDIGNLPAWVCLIAADYILTPIVPEKFSAQAISGVDHRMADAQQHNPALRFLGYVVNQRKSGVSYHQVNEERLRGIHGDRVLDTTMSNLIAFAEAQGLGKTITDYQKKGQAVKQTRQLAKEIQARIERVNQQRRVA